MRERRLVFEKGIFYASRHCAENACLFKKLIRSSGVFSAVARSERKEHAVNA
jgi:hypothetical protein